MIIRESLPTQISEALARVESTLPASHCPHSGLQVAAGLALSNGGLVTGVNVESDSYGLTLCAERTAIARAQTEGSAHLVESIIVTAGWRDATKPPIPLSPCGACRQWIAELSQRLNRDLPVYCFWIGDERGSLFRASELLPSSFSVDPNKNPTS